MSAETLAGSAAGAFPDPMKIPPNCVVLDTETTGFDPETGDKLVEIGAVRMRDGLPTKEQFHTYINPERSVPEGAVKVHGLTAAFLADKPLFGEVVQDFLSFVGDDPVVAHNAGFDAKFVNAALRDHGLAEIPAGMFVDSVVIARKRFPGSQANLDALCKRFKISLAGRDLHGALIDARLLAEVCVELAGGRQTDLFGAMQRSEPGRVVNAGAASSAPTAPGLIRYATASEIEAHDQLVAKLGADSVWARLAHAYAASPSGDRPHD
jgi:DNA polymerase-3 subunit epsilon